MARGNAPRRSGRRHAAAARQHAAALVEARSVYLQTETFQRDGAVGAAALAAADMLGRAGRMRPHGGGSRRAALERMVAVAGKQADDYAVPRIIEADAPAGQETLIATITGAALAGYEETMQNGIPQPPQEAIT